MRALSRCHVAYGEPQAQGAGKGVASAIYADLFCCCCRSVGHISSLSTQRRRTPQARPQRLVPWRTWGRVSRRRRPLFPPISTLPTIVLVSPPSMVRPCARWALCGVPAGAYCTSSGQGPEPTCACFTEQGTKARVKLEMRKHFAPNGRTTRPGHGL